MANLKTNGLTDAEDIELQRLLQKWNDAGAGMLSDKTFTAFARTVPQICVEIISFRQNPSSGSIETLMLQRPEDDIVWPGMLNFPGKAMRTCDFVAEGFSPQESTIKRLEDEELGFHFPEEPVFVDNTICMTERGPALILCYMGKLDEETCKLPKNAVWKDILELETDPKFIKSEAFPLATVLKYLKQNPII